MADINLIKTLRERTGAGFLDCKKALDENNNDIEKSLEWLRAKGITKALKKESRIAAEGVVTLLINGNICSILEINSETDFVANSPDFQNATKIISEAVINLFANNLNADINDTIVDNKPLADYITNLRAVIGEKIEVRQHSLLVKKDSECFGSYVHFTKKIASAIVVNSDNVEVANQVAMQIASQDPKYLNYKDIPEEVIAKERAIQSELTNNDEKTKDKPEAMKAGIIESKVKKILSESVLSLQQFILDESLTIEKLLAQSKLVASKFARIKVGEGIAKREDNFLEEVAKQMR